MRRYVKGGAVTLGTALVFFGTWNIIGLTLYKRYISEGEKKEPGQWKNATGAQHYLRLINFGEGNIKKVTISGLNITQQDVTPEDLQKIKGYNTDNPES